MKGLFNPKWVGTRRLRTTFLKKEQGHRRACQWSPLAQVQGFTLDCRQKCIQSFLFPCQRVTRGQRDIQFIFKGHLEHFESSSFCSPSRAELCSRVTYRKGQLSLRNIGMYHIGRIKYGTFYVITPHCHYLMWPAQPLICK